VPQQEDKSNDEIICHVFFPILANFAHLEKKCTTAERETDKEALH
jgi:hypothetical protein